MFLSICCSVPIFPYHFARHQVPLLIELSYCICLISAISSKKFREKRYVTFITLSLQMLIGALIIGLFSELPNKYYSIIGII